MSLHVPMNDLRRFVLLEKDAIEQEVSKFLSSGSYVLGDSVSKFESEWSEMHIARFGIGVSDGTSGLALALMCARMLHPDAQKVAMVANAGGYALTACRLAGLEPVFVDVGQEGSMDLCQLEDLLDDSFAAVVFTHLYGLITDLADLRDLCASLPGSPLIVEDASQAHGFTRSGRYAGEWGDVAVFSLYPTKNLGALGDAGVITTNSEKIAEWIRNARNYGWTSRYRMGATTTMNARLDELQACILLTFLPHLEVRNERRREIAEIYNGVFDGSEFVKPVIQHPDNCVYHIFALLAETEALREKARELLASHGCSTDIHFPLADTEQLPQIETIDLQDASRSTSMAEKWCKQVFSIPIFPDMTDVEINRVVTALEKF